MPEAPPDVLNNGVLRRFSGDGINTIIIRKQPLERLADLLSRTVERLVLDRTGAQGKYSFILSWTTPARRSQPEPEADLGVPVFTAIQRQLGLKLESGKEMVEVFVVDACERIPTEI